MKTPEQIENERLAPAPTTAAPAELPNRREFHVSTPAEFAAAAQVAQGGDAIIVPAEWPRESPAERPFRLPEPVLSREEGEAALRDLAVMRGDAPAEQLSGKVETTFAWLAEHRPPGATREPCYGGEDANGVAFHTADHNAAKRFPTKAAAEAWITERIPREGFKAVEHGWFGSPAEQPGKAADPRPAQPQAPAEQWRSPECQYELPRLLEIASRHVPQEAEAFVRDLRAAAEHFREHPPAAPSEAPLAEEPRCQAVTRNGHRCGKEPHEEGDDEHEADNAAEGGSTLVWTEHYPHAEAPLDALREALGDATVYALRVGKALRDLIDVVSSDGDEPRRMRHAVSKAVTEGRAALSAPPPPPRELPATTKKEG